MAKKMNRRWAAPSRYPRTARVNEVLREVIASVLERIQDEDTRLELVTITGVDCESDLRNAKVFFSAIASTLSTSEVIDALQDNRVELQAAIGSQMRLKRTPLLQFLPDASIEEGFKVEQILHEIRTNARPVDDSLDSDGEDQ